MMPNILMIFFKEVAEEKNPKPALCPQAVYPKLNACLCKSLLLQSTALIFRDKTLYALFAHREHTVCHSCSEAFLYISLIELELI